MANAFTGQSPGPTTYQSILRTFDTTLSGSLTAISDGAGNDSPLSLSTGKVAISGSTLQISGVNITADPNQINKNARTLSDGLVEVNKVIVASGNGAVNFLGYRILNPKFLNYTTTYTNKGSVPTPSTINLDSGGQLQRAILPADTTFAFSTTVASGQAYQFELLVRQDNTGGWDATWPASVQWYHDNEPTLRTGAFDQNLFRFITYDGGTSWLGHEVATDLQNITIMSPVSGEYLVYDGVNWLNLTASQAGAVATSGQTLDTIYSDDRWELFSGNIPQSGYHNGHKVLAFDGSTAESGVAPIMIPTHYNRQGINVTLVWTSVSATGGGVTWDVAFDRLSEGLDNINISTFDTALSVTENAPNPSGLIVCSHKYFTHSQIDGLLPGEAGRIMVRRDPADAGDTMVGDARLLRVRITEAVASGCS